MIKMAFTIQLATLMVGISAAWAGREPGQVSGLPPVGEEALQHPGRIVSKYDRLTQHTKTEVLLDATEKQRNGLYLYVYFVSAGETPAGASEAYIGVVSVSPREQYQQVRDVTLTLDEQQPQYYPRVSHSAETRSDGSILELLLISATFAPDELLTFAASKQLTVRLGSATGFQLREAHLRTLAELAARMQAGRLGAACGMSGGIPQER